MPPMACLDYFCLPMYLDGLRMACNDCSKAVAACKAVGDGAKTGSTDMDLICCKDPFWCCSTCCCDAVVQARTHSEITGHSCEVQYIGRQFIGCCCFGPCYDAHVTTQGREKFGLKGSKQMDCIMNCCCLGPCVLHALSKAVGNFPDAAEAKAQAQASAAAAKAKAAEKKLELAPTGAAVERSA